MGRKLLEICEDGDDFVISMNKGLIGRLVPENTENDLNHIDSKAYSGDTISSIVRTYIGNCAMEVGVDPKETSVVLEANSTDMIEMRVSIGENVRKNMNLYSIGQVLQCQSSRATEENVSMSVYMAINGLACQIIGTIVNGIRLREFDKLGFLEKDTRQKAIDQYNAEIESKIFAAAEEYKAAMSAGNDLAKAMSPSVDFIAKTGQFKEIHSPEGVEG